MNQSRSTPTNVKHELEPSGGVTSSFLGAHDPCTGETGPMFGLIVYFTWGTSRAAHPPHAQPGLFTQSAPKSREIHRQILVPSSSPGQPPYLPLLVPLGPCPPGPPVCQASAPVAFTFKCFSSSRLYLKHGFPLQVLCPHLPLSLLNNVASFLPNFRSH